MSSFSELILANCSLATSFLICVYLSKASRYHLWFAIYVKKISKNCCCWSPVKFARGDALVFFGFHSIALTGLTMANILKKIILRAEGQQNNKAIKELRKRKMVEALHSMKHNFKVTSTSLVYICFLRGSQRTDDTCVMCIKSNFSGVE